MNFKPTILAITCISLTTLSAQQFRIAGLNFESQEAFAELGYRCGTRPPSDLQRTSDRLRAARFRAANPGFAERAAEITIPVRFHVIMDDDGTGDIKDAKLDEQIKVMNETYKPHQMQFSRASVSRTKKKKWYRMAMGSAAEREAKTKLGKDQETHLNLYIAGIEGGVLGWATFPLELAGDPKMDGVVIVNTSLPGGEGVYNLGKTAVHECGHWLGLYHTFQGGCKAPGDEVDDTPAEATPATGTCEKNKNRDSCQAEAGADDFKNYMDYVDDACMNHFSQGQSERMRNQIAMYRSKLLPSNTRRTLMVEPLN